ncbi:MAG TPA: LLM class F420-dependent oxidoreductase [Acidimicrobiales bacterium]|jgi:probable F420-dependent oxidoreductase
MKFLTEYPLSSTAAGGAFNQAAKMAEFLQVAEASGLDGVGFTDHVAPSRKWMDRGGHETLEPFVALAYCAGVTTTMRLVTHMAVAPYRNPFLLAKEITTLDVVSGGRATIGLGSGYLRSEFSALGVEFRERGELFDESIEVLERIFSDDDVAYEGRHFQAVGQILEPGPVQRPHPPFWFGGNTDRVLDRVARHGAGWAPMTLGPQLAATTRTREITSNEHLRSLIGQLGDRLEANGRARDEVDVSAMSVGSFVSAADSMERHLDVIGELADIGVTWTMFPYPRDDFDAALDYLRAFGEAVAAKVR